MTERERDILRALIDLLAGDRPVVATEAVKLLEKAQELLDVTTDPEPEHPALEAYRKWRDSLDSGSHGMAEGFLAGWTLSLMHIAGNYDAISQTHAHLMDAATATPTQLR